MPAEPPGNSMSLFTCITMVMLLLKDRVEHRQWNAERQHEAVPAFSISLWCVHRLFETGSHDTSPPQSWVLADTTP